MFRDGNAIILIFFLNTLTFLTNNYKMHNSNAFYNIYLLLQEVEEATIQSVKGHSTE